jgi:hypothetical protein
VCVCDNITNSVPKGQGEASSLLETSLPGVSLVPVTGRSLVS